MKETFLPSKPFIRKQWYVIDAENKKLGKLATQIASILKGKNKSYYTPYLDTGDYIIIINSSKVTISGNKNIQKLYRNHSGRPGGMSIENFEKLKQRLPNHIIEKAVKGMLPKGSLGRKILQNLYIYSTDLHPHQAQKPEKISL
jgi:large subunit ribosomal protein L13